MHNRFRNGAMLALVALVTATGGQALAGHGGNGGWKRIRQRTAKLPCEASSVTAGETSENLSTLARLPWPNPSITTGELDIHEHLLVGHLFSSPGGLMTVDVSNPLKPTILGQAVVNHFTYDVKLTADGTTALVGFDTGLANGGVAAVDVRDPTQPRLMDEWVSDRPGPLQNGHMLYTANIDDTDWVFLAPNDSTGVWILRLNGPPGDRTIEYVTQTLPVEGGPLGPHDMYIQFDRELDTWVLYAADGFLGWLAFDISNPALPIPLGGLPHPSSGYTHTIQAAWIKGRRIVATIEEVGLNLLEVYDATNLQAPVLLGTWSSEPVPTASQHNFQIVKGRLYMAHYGGGMYVFDLRDLPATPSPTAPALSPMAHYLPQGSAFWDVLVKDGLLYLGRFQAGAGIDVVGFGCNRPGTPSLTSTG